MGPRKNLSPDRIWTHDLPNTGQALYPLSYENSWRARSFNWVHMWQASCILLGLALLKSSTSLDRCLRSQQRLTTQQSSYHLSFLSCTRQWYKLSIDSSPVSYHSNMRSPTIREPVWLWWSAGLSWICLESTNREGTMQILKVSDKYFSLSSSKAGNGPPRLA